MKRKLISCFTLMSCIVTLAQELKEQKDSTSVKIGSTEKNRNIELNAQSNTGPRSVDIGIPIDDVVILENGVPAVYFFYPTHPLSAWRMDNSLSQMGLLSLGETAITTGKVGMGVQSTSRGASRSFAGYASTYMNSFGSSRFDFALTGPIKNGWGYMLSGYQTYDHGNGVNYKYTEWTDKTSLIKGSIQKDYKKGYVRLMYKYVNSYNNMINNNYNPVRYLGDGKTEKYQYGDTSFDMGKDAYTLASGRVPAIDPMTGEHRWADLGSDEFLTTVVHSLYLQGEHKFDNGWKFSYTSMFQKNNSPFGVTFPISNRIKEPGQPGYNLAGDATPNLYYYYGTDKAYTGPVQMWSNGLIAQSRNDYWANRFEFAKKIKDHNVRFGLNYQYYFREYTNYGGMYFSTVEPSPSLLTVKMDYSSALGYPAGSVIVPFTDENGTLAGNVGAYVKDRTRKTAFYVSDDFKLGPLVDLSIGGRIEHQKLTDYHNPNPSNVAINDGAPLIVKDFNNFNYVATTNAVVKVTKNFGLLADLYYNNYNQDMAWDFSDRDPVSGEPADGALSDKGGITNTKVISCAGGIFLNMGKKFSIVSKITKISRLDNLYTNATITNPVNPTETKNFNPIFYDVNTVGWTTDILAEPFKNFTIHTLLTLQNPQYDNFAFSAFDVTYDYNGKNLVGISKTLIEIDPSYSFFQGKMRGWLSLRYFGKQYGSMLNSFSYNPWWENFGGIDFTVNRKLQFKFQVTNFLDQKGVKGKVQGSDQITQQNVMDEYIGRPIVAGAIRPRTFEFTVNYKF